VLVALVALLGGLFFLTQGPSGDPAFTVYGEPTSREELREELDGLVSDEALETLGSDEATPEQQAEVAQAMSALITLEVLSEAAEDEGIEVTEEDVDAELAEVVETAFGGDPEAFQAQLDQAGLTEDTVRAQFRTALLAEALVGEPADIDPADVQAAYDAQFANPVVSHILVETEEEAQAALERIEAGEDFAAVAQDVSIDSSAEQGGQLGPLQPGQFVPEFEEAALALEPGEVSDPVETEFGYHLITVGEPVPFEDVEAQITQQLTDAELGQSFTALAERLEAEAEITVDPAFGTWTGLTQGGLVPPTAAAQGQPAPPEQPPANE
jgi:foldase protein PrsA